MIRIPLILVTLLGTVPGKSTVMSASSQIDLRPGPTSNTYWVMQQHPTASDDNSGTRHQPWKTLARATKPGTLSPGDTVRIGAGTYRESILLHQGGTGPNARITFAAVPGDSVIVSGADSLGTIVREYEPGLWAIGGYNVLPWPSSYERYGRDLIVLGGTTLRPVFTRNELSPGTFLIPSAASGSSIILIRPPKHEHRPAGQIPVEIGRRQVLFGPAYRSGLRVECDDPAAASWLRVEGIIFRHAANMAQHGAVCLAGTGSIAENITAEWNNGLGIEVDGSHHRVVKSMTRMNGQAGIGGSCRKCRIIDVVSAENNWRGHSPFWEAGGGKWSDTYRTIFRRYHARNNVGPGLWLDIDNHDNLIEESTFVGNSVAGVMIELNTTKTIVRDCDIRRTRRYEWSGAGILIQAASSSTIENNRISNNDGAGIWIRADDREETTDHYLLNNTIWDNALIPGQDRADIQISAHTERELTSNRLSGNRFPSEMAEGACRYLFRSLNNNNDICTRNAGDLKSSF